MMKDLLWLEAPRADLKRQSELLSDITDNTAINDRIYKNLRACSSIAAISILHIKVMTLLLDKIKKELE